MIVLNCEYRMALSTIPGYIGHRELRAYATRIGADPEDIRRKETPHAHLPVSEDLYGEAVSEAGQVLGPSQTASVVRQKVSRREPKTNHCTNSKLQRHESKRESTGEDDEGQPGPGD